MKHISHLAINDKADRVEVAVRFQVTLMLAQQRNCLLGLSDGL